VGFTKLLTQIKLFSLYQTSLYYYDVVNELHNDTEEAIAVQSNTVNDRRNKYLTFVCSNNYRQGFRAIARGGPPGPRP